MNKCEHEEFKLEDIINEILYFECLKCKAIFSIYARDLDLENEGNVSPWMEKNKCKSCGRLNYD